MSKAIRNAFTRSSLEKQQELIDLYYDLFAGRLDTYAIRVEFNDSAAYLPSTYTAEEEEKRWVEEKVRRITKEIGTTEFGPEAIRAHLEGRQLLGVYPIQPNSTVRWFALDFDKKKETDPDPWQAAVAQAETFVTEAGLPVYIERSQGGKGFHVWGFLDGEVDAGKLRHALKPLIDDAATYDRMFPNQDGISETCPLGNLIALPLHGERVIWQNSSFVKRGKKGLPEAHPDQWELLQNIERIPVEKIEELFEQAGEYVPEREHTKYEGEAEGLTDGWKVVHPRFGCEWVRWCYENPEQVTEPQWYALACNFAQLENGRELFHEWSRQDKERYNARRTDKKYDQALKQNKPHSCEVIRELGGNCRCDERFDKVYHPFDLAKLSFRQLVDSIGVDDEEATITTGDVGFDAAIDWIREIEKDPEKGQGWRYGIKGLDAVTRLRGSDLIIIGGRPGMGKTAFMNSTINGLIETNSPSVPSYVFSMEMSALQVYKRQLSVATKVSQTRMATGQLTGEDWKKINAERDRLRDKSQYPIFVDDMSRSVDRIFEMAARLVHTHGPGVIWIDYLQLAQRLPRESMFDAVTRIVHDLKLLAKALNVPVVALTQLNRTADDATADSQTFDSMLRGSGDIEQAADVIIFILGEKGPGVKDRALMLHKERHREGGIKVPTEFNQPIMTFGDQGTWSERSNRPSRRPRADDTEDDLDEEFAEVDAPPMVDEADEEDAALPF